MNEAYFRIPKGKDKDKVFQYIAIALENQNRSTKEGILFESKLYESASGYKYQIGWLNDTKIGEKNIAHHNIYCLAHRYLSEKDLQTITQSICIIQGLEYIYNLNFEQVLFQEIKQCISIFNKQTKKTFSFDYFSTTRELINNFLNENKFNEKILEDPIIQDKIIKYIKNEIKFKRMKCA